MDENIAGTSSGTDAATSLPAAPGIPPAYPGPVQRRSPALAAFLSFFPGFGHLYNGEIGKALAFFSAFATCIFVMAETDGGSVFFGLLIPFIIFYNMIEAYRSAERINLQALSGVSATEEPASNQLWGWSLVAMGGLLLLHNLGLFRFVWIAKMWPLLMIAAGVALLRGSLFGSRQ
jgi:TM2 domain-containing membrane protein YozV